MAMSVSWLYLEVCGNLTVFDGYRKVTEVDIVLK